MRRAVLAGALSICVSSGPITAGSVEISGPSLAETVLTATASQPDLAATEAPGSSDAQKPVSLDALPPMLRLGARVGAMSQRIPAAPVVVIANDGESYRYAISKWRLTLRFPVLIDDGSWASAQRIARFVRAYKPSSVLRVRAPGQKAGAEGEPGDTRRSDPAELVKEMDRAIASAWTIRAEDEPIPAERLGELWSQLKFEPFGVIVADPSDPTWPAAVALAAGHGQPVLWLPYPKQFAGNVGGTLTADELRELNEAITQRLRAMGRPFEGLGDDIDALTLCFDGPIKVAPSSTDKALQIALSDCLGRVFDEQQRPGSKRWAWCGQIVGGGGGGGPGGSGGESSAAYDAMCSLFLRARMAWLFDGYDDKEPYSAYDATLAATALEREGVRTVVDDNDSRGATDFRKRAAGIGWPWRDRYGAGREPAAGEDRNDGKAAAAASLRRGIDAELIMVNTSGNPEFFDLKPGQAKPADLPILWHPAAVYFVHSWSAANLANVEFIAGRWRQRGAYAYCGSVHEPYLQGFVPTPVVAARLVAGVPWGAAVRLEEGQAWKIVCLGDPLMLVRGDVPKSAPETGRLTFEGLSDVNDEMVLALKAREFGKALRDLTLMARYRDAVKLLAAIAAEAPAGGGLSAAEAMEGLGAAYFDAEPALFARVVGTALERIRLSREWGSSAIVDMAWQAMWPRLDFLTPEEVEALGRSQRGATRDRDASEYQRAVQGVRGR